MHYKAARYLLLYYFSGRTTQKLQEKFLKKRKKLSRESVEQFLTFVLWSVVSEVGSQNLRNFDHGLNGRGFVELLC